MHRPPATGPEDLADPAGPSIAPPLSVHRLAGLIFGGIGVVLLAFAASGVWFTAQIQGVGLAIDLAGSQRYGLYQTADLLRHAQAAPSPERARLAGKVHESIKRTGEVFDALRVGSAEYGIGDVSGPAVDRVLQQAAAQWHAQIAPRLNAIQLASPEEAAVLLAGLNPYVDDFVNQYLNATVAAFAAQQEEAVRRFILVRYVLALTGMLLLIAGFFYTRRQLLAPIRTLIEDTTRIANGEYGLETVVDARNELGTLATRFNHMSATLDRTIKGLASTIADRTRHLETSQKRLQSLIDNAPDAIIVLRAEDNRILLFSRGAERMFGYRPEEMTGRDIAILLPERQGAPIENHDGQQLPPAFLRPGLPGEIQGALACRKGGTRFHVDISMSETGADGERTRTAIIRDVSARIEAEHAIAEKNRELAVTARIDHIGAQVMLALNQQEGDARWTQDVLQIIATDAGYRPLAFYQYDEWEGGLLLAASLGMARSPDKRMIPLGAGLLGEAAERREALFVDDSADETFQLDSGVGVLRAHTLFALPIVHGERLLGVISGASQHTLTERERSWLCQLAGQMAIGLHALHQYRELQDLTEQLNARSLRIETQNRELAHASRLKSEFLASMSHELRTPLNAIIGFSEMMRDGLAGPMSARQVDYISEVYQSGRHLLSLINDILDLSKIEAGKMELNLEAVNLNELIDNAITIMRERASKGGVALTKSVAPNVSDVVADGRRVRQIVYNLLSNAVKFTPQGGSVRIEAAVRGGDIEISVIDTGIGIAADDQERLFRAFEQLDSGIDRKFEGTGLGLVMVKSLVELHEGTLGVESAQGKGSRFWVRLPLRRDETVRPAKSPAMSLPGASGSQIPCVLVVDDDPAALSLARRWLTGAGYAVEMAPDCDAAWRKLERRPISVILLDILFAQGPGGWEWLERIKQQPQFASIPVIVISIAADLEKGIALGAEAVLQKPVNGQDLLSTVESLGLLRNGCGGTPRILVVDDDPGSVERIARQLERAGMLVSRAYSGADAIAAAYGQHLAAVVLDMAMPEVSGVDVVRELRGNPHTKDLPVIMMTSGTLEPGERANLEQSVASVLSKGQWDEGRFLRVVRSAVYSRPHRKLDTPLFPERPSTARRVDEEPGAHRAVAQPEGNQQLDPTPDQPTDTPRTDKNGLEGALATILVVDDDPAAREQLRIYLESADYCVMTAASAEEALACLARARPDLITLDLHLPGTSGLQLLTGKADNQTLAGIPVLVVSGAEHPEEALGVGANAVLCKPVRRHELLGVVTLLISEAKHSIAPRVLVVDDDPRAVTLITALLAPEDIDVVGVYGGREALNAIDQQLPDLIILDLMMPGVSGFDVLASLRLNDAARDIPVIILTAKSLTERERTELARSAQSVLQKTTTAKTVLAEVRRLIARTAANPDT